MNPQSFIKPAVICLLMLSALTLGCSSSGRMIGDPIMPDSCLLARQAMYFTAGTQTIFGTEDNPASEVDLASVVWSMMPLSIACGDIVEFNDGTRWVASIGIEYTDDDEDPTVPTIRFLSDDGETMSSKFSVRPSPMGVSKYCRFPRIDCTYLGPGLNGNGITEVTVAFRYGNHSVSWIEQLATWDLQVVRLRFRYNPSTGWVKEQIPPQNNITSGWMTAPNSGQTHPDIAYDQKSGDLYCAWTNLSPGYVVDVKYQRYDHSLSSWSPLLRSLGRPGMGGGWFVSLDTGIVSLPGEDDERLVGFAYTGQNPNGAGEFPIGYHPLVGYWSIESGVSDIDHEPQFLIIDPKYMPDEYNTFHAGLVKVDIPSDSASYHGAAIVFVQDTQYYESTGQYQITGFDSLSTYGFDLISDFESEEVDLDEATLPSIAVHNDYGNTAAVTYFARLESGDWAVWATHWDFVSGSVSLPTEVDPGASGTFELDIDKLLNYDWGTGSSLVSIGYNQYWAGWSDEFGGSEPTRVLGSMGFADYE